MLYDQRVSANSNHFSSTTGKGVNALATKDSSGNMAVLLWNYQDSGGTDAYDTTVDINNLPSQLQGTVHMEQYLVNTDHSNYADTHDLADADLEKVVDVIDDVNSSSFSTIVTMRRNAVRLVVLTPATANPIKGY